MNNPASWDLFNLTINTVQLQKNALDMVEWEMLLPLVQKGKDSPPHKVSKVLFPVRRLSWFYMHNIVLMMFTMDVSALGSRVSTVCADHHHHRDGFQAHHLAILCVGVLPGAHGRAALSVVPGMSFIRDGPVWNTRLVSAFAVLVIAELVLWLAWAEHVVRQGAKTGQIDRAHNGV